MINWKSELFSPKTPLQVLARRREDLCESCLVRLRGSILRELVLVGDHDTLLVLSSCPLELGQVVKVGYSKINRLGFVLWGKVLANCGRWFSLPIYRVFDLFCLLFSLLPKSSTPPRVCRFHLCPLFLFCVLPLLVCEIERSGRNHPTPDQVVSEPTLINLVFRVRKIYKVSSPFTR